MYNHRDERPVSGPLGRIVTRKSWHLSRRTFLQGSGVSLALPYLECMAADAGAAAQPKRFCSVYFPYGIVQRQAGTEAAQWNWFPQGSGRDFQFNKSLASLEQHRADLTVLGGLSHPNGRNMGGHDTADTWLTGAELKEGHLENTVSIDQLAAGSFGGRTRYPSLVLSSDGGVGEPTRSSTLSFGRTGQPVPAENRPRLVFERLFGVDPRSLVSQRQSLDNSRSMLDLVLDHSRSMRSRLGAHDRTKLDEYLTSVRQIERRVGRSQQWLDVPKPNVPATGLHLDADDTTPGELIKTMYDLIYLAFQTDSTRIATYQLGNMNGATSIAGKFPPLLGLSNNMHTLAHGARKNDDGAEPLGHWDRFLTEQFSYFVSRLKQTPEGDGTLLDRTILFYGSSNSQTHVNLDYPLLLAGGRELGLKHGSFLRFGEEIPLANLFVTILNRLDVPAESFVDSTGELNEILA